MAKLWGMLVLMLACTALAQSIERYDDWRLERAVDPFTDENDSAIYVFPVEYPQYGDGDLFALLCAEGIGTVDGVAVMLMGSSYISERTSSVTYRVDSNPPVTQTWDATDDTIFPRESQIQSLVPALLAGTKFAIRFDAYRSSPTYIYSISGFREALDQLGCYRGLR